MVSSPPFCSFPVIYVFSLFQLFGLQHYLYIKIADNALTICRVFISPTGPSPTTGLIQTRGDGGRHPSSRYVVHVHCAHDKLVMRTYVLICQLKVPKWYALLYTTWLPELMGSMATCTKIVQLHVPWTIENSRLLSWKTRYLVSDKLYTVQTVSIRWVYKRFLISHLEESLQIVVSFLVTVNL